MSDTHLKNVIEAAMLAAGRPLTVAELAQLFEETGRPEAPEIRAALDQLAAEYEGRGIEVKEIATGFRIQVRKDIASEVSRLWPERPPKYSRALLETLALIAYRQPITRAEIEAVRGVAVNPNIIKTLLERNWVRVVGQRDVPGRPELLGTTKDFLDYFSLRSLDELPPLAELKNMTDPNLQLELANPAVVAALPNPDAEAETVDEPALLPLEVENDSSEPVVEVAESEPEPEVSAQQEVAAESDSDAEADSDDEQEADTDSVSLDDDLADDDLDDDERSADSEASDELVAAPRRFDD